MNIIIRIYRKVKNVIWQKNREKLNQEARKKLTEQARTASIISCNCTGGILSHDLGLQFLSPTVNLFMPAEDFIKFCENLRGYMAIDQFTPCEDVEVIGDRNYPVGHLGDLTVFFVHYHTLEEAQEKWNQRKARINWDNIVVLGTDRDGVTKEIKDRFEKLPYKKVMFTHLPDESHKSCFYLSGFEKDASVGIITDHTTWNGTRPVDQFDYVKFLNEEFRGGL